MMAETASPVSMVWAEFAASGEMVVLLSGLGYSVTLLAGLRGGTFHEYAARLGFDLP